MEQKIDMAKLEQAMSLPKINISELRKNLSKKAANRRRNTLAKISRRKNRGK